jgi:hypothetical protein
VGREVSHVSSPHGVFCDLREGLLFSLWLDLRVFCLITFRVIEWLSSLICRTSREFFCFVFWLCFFFFFFCRNRKKKKIVWVEILWSNFIVFFVFVARSMLICRAFWDTHLSVEFVIALRSYRLQPRPCGSSVVGA